MEDIQKDADDHRRFYDGNDYTADFKCFDDCLRDAGAPRPGFWSAWATLAWIATGSERFVAASQDYEEQSHANRGDLFTSAAWLVLTDRAEGFPGGKSFALAERELRLAIETESLLGGVATDRQMNKPRPLLTYEWLAWQRSFERVGLVLVPGFSDFRWPSGAVRQAFASTKLFADQTEPMIHPDAWTRRKPTREQLRLFDFFAAAASHMDGGADPISKTELLKKYQAWMATKVAKGIPLKRSAFELWLGRFKLGGRPRGDRCGWVVVSG